MAGETEPGGAPRRDPGDGPRLRLTAAASRRTAPSRPTALRADPAPAPAAVVPPPDEPPPGAPRSRRTVLGPVLGVTGALVLLVGAALLLSPTGPSGADVVPATSTQSQEAPPGEFDPPVVLAPDSEYVETAVRDDDLLVTHWISTTTPMDQLRVRAPRSPGLADLRLEVEDLVVVAADGDLVDVDEVSLDVPSTLPSVRSLYVRYRLPGALQRNSSVTDRALATVTSLGIGLAGRSLPRTQSFPGGRVMTVACLAQGAHAVPEPCGTYVEGAWQVTSPAGDVPVTVIAQFDLAVVR